MCRAWANGGMRCVGSRARRGGTRRQAIGVGAESPGSVRTGFASAPYLQAILGQLVVMNNELHRATDAEHARGRACSYADKAYTEGSLLKVEGVKLLCVEAVAGADQWGVVPEAGAPADGEKRFVWKPLGSPRLARFRETEWHSPLVK